MVLKAIGGALGLGPQKTTRTQTSTPTAPPEVEAARRDLVRRASEFAATPYEAFTGEQVAGFTPDQLAAFESARNVASASGALAPLTGELVQEGVGAARDLATRLPETDLSGYMSPYLEGVLDPAIRDIEERATRERIRLGQQAARTGAFGGSRQAIAEAELERGTQRNIGEESARQRQQAYNTALQQFRLDQERIPALYAGALNQVGTGIGQTAARLGTEVNPLLQTGAAQQGLEQARLNVARQQFEEERDFPLRGIEVLRSTLGLPAQSLGIGSTGTTTETTPGPNILSQITGGLIQAPKIIAGGKAAAGGLSSLASFLPFLSDEGMKTDIEEVGEDPETGLMMYAFRYKGDPKTYPKVVGPMAQDVEEMYPGQVKEVAGRKVIVGGLDGLRPDDDDNDDDDDFEDDED